MINSSIVSNTAFTDGGGIFNTANPSGVGTVTLNQSTIADNKADDGGVPGAFGTIYYSSDGGGIYNVGLGSVVNLNNSVVQGNIASGSLFNGGGGGIFNSINATLNLNNSTVMLNSATHGHGGGINNQGSGKLNVTSSTIADNTAAANGGGIFDKDGGSVAILHNTSFSGNAAGTNGGGIYNATSGSMTIIHATIADNSAGSNGGGIRNQQNGIVTIKNSIVANSSSGGNCSDTAILISNGDNISSDATCTSFTSGGDMTSTDPMLIAMQDNGGPRDGANESQPTLTYALMVGSPALDAAGFVAGMENDERGFTRGYTQSGVVYFCDIGAYEAAVWVSKTASPTTVLTGENLTYTLDYAYMGQGVAQNVMITDTISAYLTNLNVTSSGAVITDTGTNPAYVWLVQDLLPGQGGTITITGQVDGVTPVGALLNNATIYGMLEGGNPGNSTNIVTVTVDTAADLTIVMADTPDPVVAGELLTYTVTVTNQGPADALDVAVSDTLPMGVSGPVTSGCAEDPIGAPTCSLGTIAVSDSAVYTLTVTVDPDTTGSLINTAQVTASTNLINTGDDSTNATTSVNAEADLALSKLVSSQTVPLTETVSVDAGSLVTFTLTLGNSGPSAAAAGTEVSDLLPAGLTFESLVSASAGTFGQVGNQISWTSLPQIAPSADQTLIYRATVDAGTEGRLSRTAPQSARPSKPIRTAATIRARQPSL